MDTLKLHVMNDRFNLGSILVADDDLDEAFGAALDLIEEHLEEFLCDTYDVDKDEWKWARRAMAQARLGNTSRRSITDFNILDLSTGQTRFSIVWHES